MNLKSVSKISIDDKRLRSFGNAAISMLNVLFPEDYYLVIVSQPSFSDVLRANIAPQFSQGSFHVISIDPQSRRPGESKSNVRHFDGTGDPEDILDHYRFENAIFASENLGILTAWAQADYAIVAFRNELINEHEEWIGAMASMNVLHEIV